MRLGCLLLAAVEAGSPRLLCRELTRAALAEAGGRTQVLGVQAEARIIVSVYVSMARLRVAPERAQEVVSAFRRRAHLVDQAPGFRNLEVWRNDRDAAELVMVSRWTDRECFKSYMKSEAHRLSHDRIDPELDAEIKLEALEHMHTFDVVAD